VRAGAPPSTPTPPQRSPPSPPYLFIERRIKRTLRVPTVPPTPAVLVDRASSSTRTSRTAGATDAAPPSTPTSRTNSDQALPSRPISRTDGASNDPVLSILRGLRQELCLPLVPYAASVLGPVARRACTSLGDDEGAVGRAVSTSEQRLAKRRARGGDVGGAVFVVVNNSRNAAFVVTDRSSLALHALFGVQPPVRETRGLQKRDWTERKGKQR
jgi:hypothetical protein